MSEKTAQAKGWLTLAISVIGLILGGIAAAEAAHTLKTQGGKSK